MALFNGLARIQLLSSLVTGQGVSNTFYLSKSGAGSPPSLTNLNDLSTQLYTWLGTQYRALLGTNAQFNSISAEQVSDPLSPVTVLKYVNTLNVAGSRTPASPAAPQSATAVMSLQTPNASRRFRGHLFMPPFLDPSNMSGDSWNTGSGNWTSLSSFNSKMNAGCGTSPTWTGAELSGWTLSIYSRTAAMAGDPSVAICSATICSPRIHWLRSRERGST